MSHLVAKEYKLVSQSTRESLTTIVQGHIEQGCGWRPEGAVVHIKVNPHAASMEFVQTMVRYEEAPGKF